PLLNYRKSKRRTLQVVDQLPNVIYERLVEAGKPLILDPVPDPLARNVTDDQDARPPALVTSGQADTDGHEASPGSASKHAQAASGRPSSNAAPAGKGLEGLLQYPLRLPEHVSELHGRSARTVDDKLQTNLTKERLDSLIRYMQREAGTAM